MPYNENIEKRINQILSDIKNIQSKKMFGGICALLNGNMFCGVYKDFLILRLGSNFKDEMFSLPHVKPFDITGKPMKGWIMISEDGFKADEDLSGWINKALDYVKTLPPKTK